MRSQGRRTRWISVWLTVVLLSMQLATAAHACPARLATEHAPPVMAAMPGCDEHMPAAMDPDQQQQCKAHCQQGSQTVHPTPASDAPAAPVLLAVLDWTSAALLPTLPAARATVVTAGGSPPGSPPLYLSLLVLRN
jgi:hypothetical protein